MQYMRLACFILWVIIIFPSLGQDQRFSQSNYIPLQINPAQVATSDFAAFLLDHREQHYANHITLQSTAITGKYPLISKTRGKRWGGVGISFINNHSDDAQFFRSQAVDATFAYNFSLPDGFFISWGIQGTHYQKSLNTNGFTTGSQYIENIGYDPQAFIGETIQNVRVNYLSIGSGFYLYTTDKREINNYIGIAAYQINHPQESFGSTVYRLPIRWVMNGGKRLFSSRTWSVTPEIFWIKEGSRSWVSIGTSCGYHFQNTNPLDPIKSGSIDFGVRYALDQAAILSVQLNQPGFTVSFSHDIPVSYAEPVSPVWGATEVAIAIKKSIVRKEPAKVTQDYSVGEVRHFYEKQIVRSDKERTKAAEKKNEHSDSLPFIGTPQVEEDLIFSLKKTFQFDFNNTALTPEAKSYFDDFISLMKLNPDLRIKVVGHTDNIGEERTNIKLSEERAQAVKDYLIDKGIDKQRIIIEGKGSSEPLFPNDTSSNRAKNRRVELVIYK